MHVALQAVLGVLPSPRLSVVLAGLLGHLIPDSAQHSTTQRGEDTTGELDIALQCPTAKCRESAQAKLCK
jgi:hypothetical protein